MLKEKTDIIFNITIIICLLALLIACQPEIEYREVIKEVPVEVIIEVPVVDESKINELISQLNNLQQQHDSQLLELEELYNKKILELNNANLDNDLLLQEIEEMELAHKKEILDLNNSFSIEKEALQIQMNNEANYQLDELKKYYDNRLLQLENAYNIKIEEINQANLDNNNLLMQINELEKLHKSQIENLNIIYNTKISELEALINSATSTKRDIFHLRVYRIKYNYFDFHIYNASDARSLFCHYLRYYTEYIPLEVDILKDIGGQLENAIMESEYVNADADTIRKAMDEDQIAYGYYCEGNWWTCNNIIVWFVVWEFHE